MDNVERYIQIRDQFLDLVVDHYKTLGSIEKTDTDIIEIREAVKENIDSMIDEIGIEDAISYVEELIENKEEYFSMTQDIFNGTYDFIKLIDKSITHVNGVNIGDILLREDDEKDILCRVVGFTHLESPIVEYLRVNLKIETPTEFMFYSEGDVKPYPYVDFYEDLF